MVTPSALAVLRLITSSKSTGSSARFASRDNRASGVTLRVDESVVKAIRYRVDGCGVVVDDGGDGACPRAGPLTRSRSGSSTNVA